MLPTNLTPVRACADEHDSNKAKRYFPFAEGPRDCLGQNLAKVSLLATAATLLSRLSFSLGSKVPSSPCLSDVGSYTLVNLSWLSHHGCMLTLAGCHDVFLQACQSRLGNSGQLTHNC